MEQIKASVIYFSSRERHNEGMPIISIGTQQHRLAAPGTIARQEYEAKILRNPFNKRNRQLLHDNYGIQLPLIEKQQQRTVTFFDFLLFIFILKFLLVNIKKYCVRKNDGTSWHFTS